MITFRIGFSYVFGVHMGWMAVGVWAAMVIDWCSAYSVLWEDIWREPGGKNVVLWCQLLDKYFT